MHIQGSSVRRKGKDGRNRKVVESYRDSETGKSRKRTILKVEKLPILERARTIYKYGGSKHLDKDEWDAMHKAGDFDSSVSETLIGDSYRGAGNWVLLQYLEKTGLGTILKKYLDTKMGNVLIDMLTLQVLDTSSKLSYAKKRLNTLNYIMGGKEYYSEETFYRALDALDDQFENIRDALNKNHPPSGKALLYDLSNSYFCGTKAELGGYGESKEKRYDRYIVSYGLVAESDNLPLDIKVWKGGTAESKTVRKTFADWKNKYYCADAVWVADRGMSGEDTLNEVQQMGLSYITGLPGASQQAMLKSIHEKNPGLFDKQITEYEEDGYRYVLCRHDEKGYRKEAQNHRNLRKAYDELKKIQASPQNTKKEKLYHRAMKVLEDYKSTTLWTLTFDTFKDKKGKDRYMMKFRLNRKELQAKNTVEHYYLLQTDLDQEKLPTQKVQQYYKNLIQVERCFRSLKSDMEIRPIRHRKEQRIRAHIYLNYLCLWLVKYIEKNWKEKGITDEVPSKLKQWDQSLLLHELWDNNTKQFLELKWNQGKIATETLQEIQSHGEMVRGLPHL